MAPSDVIAIVSVVSSAVVAVAGLVATVLSRRTDRRHEREMIRETTKSEWDVEWWRRREAVYLDVLTSVHNDFSYLYGLVHGSRFRFYFPRRPPLDEATRDLVARLDAYGSLAVNDANGEYEEARDDKLVFNYMKSRHGLATVRHFRDRLIWQIRSELEAGPTAPAPSERPAWLDEDPSTGASSDNAAR